MKGIVVKSEDNRCVTLKEDGTFVVLKGHSYGKGDVVQVKNQKSSIWKAGILSAAAVLFLVLGVGGKMYATPTYYVSLDVNPGVLLEVNQFERVIGAEGVNEEGKAILEELKLENKGVEQALRMTVEKMTEKGFVLENGVLYLATSTEETEDGTQLTDALEEALEEEIEEEGVNAQVQSGVLGYEMVQKAKELGITPGKLNIITNVLGQEATQENMDMTIKELMSLYKERGNSENAPGQNKPDKAPGKPEGTPGKGPDKNPGEDSGSEDPNSDVPNDANQNTEQNTEQNAEQNAPAQPGIPQQNQEQNGMVLQKQ